jgi:hypothetical protein
MHRRADDSMSDVFVLHRHTNSVSSVSSVVEIFAGVLATLGKQGASRT